MAEQYVEWVEDFFTVTAAGSNQTGGKYAVEALEGLALVVETESIGGTGAPSIFWEGSGDGTNFYALSGSSAQDAGSNISVDVNTSDLYRMYTVSGVAAADGPTTWMPMKWFRIRYATGTSTTANTIKVHLLKLPRPR